MVLYYIIFSLVFASCLFEFSKTKVKKQILIIWCIFFTLFGGLRWEIGGDWDQYYDHFLYSNWNNIFDYDRYGDGRETLEPGFVFVNVLIKSIFGNHYYIYNLIICAFIQFTYYKICCKYTPKFPILSYAYLMINSSNYFPVRAGFALVIAFWAYKYIKEQKLIKFLLIISIATIIHNQCLFLLPFYWLCKIRINIINFTIIYIICVAFGYIFQEYISIFSSLIEGDLAEKLHHYTQFETEGKAGANYMSWALNYVLIIIYLLYRKKNKMINVQWTNALIIMAAAHSCILIVFSEGMGDLTRLATLLLPAKVFMFVLSFIYFAKYKSSIIRISSICFLITFMAYRIYKIDEWYYFREANVPYKTIFDYNL